jgi:hypothetical protein
MAISFDDDRAFARIKTNVEVSKSIKLSDCSEPQNLMSSFEDEIENGLNTISAEYDIQDTNLFFYEYKPSQQFDEVHIANLKRHLNSYKDYYHGGA